MATMGVLRLPVASYSAHHAAMLRGARSAAASSLRSKPVRGGGVSRARGGAATVCYTEWVLDAPGRMAYRAVEQSAQKKEGHAPEAPRQVQTGSDTDRRVTQAEVHGSPTGGREQPATQPVDISAVRCMCVHACTTFHADASSCA